jgi:hypothetical protein
MPPMLLRAFKVKPPEQRRYGGTLKTNARSCKTASTIRAPTTCGVTGAHPNGLTLRAPVAPLKVLVPTSSPPKLIWIAAWMMLILPYILSNRRAPIRSLVRRGELLTPSVGRYSD